MCLYQYRLDHDARHGGAPDRTTAGRSRTGGGEMATPAEEAVEESPDVVEDGVRNFLVGQVVQKSKRSADPSGVNQSLRERLGE